MGKPVKTTGPVPHPRPQPTPLQKQGIQVSTAATAEEARRLIGVGRRLPCRVRGVQVRNVQQPQPGHPLAADQAGQVVSEVESAVAARSRRWPTVACGRFSPPAALTGLAHRPWAARDSAATSGGWLPGALCGVIAGPMAGWAKTRLGVRWCRCPAGVALAFSTCPRISCAARTRSLVASRTVAGWRPIHPARRQTWGRRGQAPQSRRPLCLPVAVNAVLTTSEQLVG
jgi:hypothetical protein